MTLKSDGKYKINWFVVSKITIMYWILTWALEILKVSTLIDSFCTEYITFDLKNYRGGIFHDTEEWCKISRKTDLWFGKWHEEFGIFSSEHLKVSQLILSWDQFVQSRRHMS